MATEETLIYPHYRPKGRALEYAQFALNIYNTCEHACTYCYNTKKQWAGKKNEDEFYKPGVPRKNIVELVRKSAAKLKSVMKPDDKVLMSFVSDPYQKSEETHQVTKHIIEIYVEHKISFDTLTKNPALALRDLDIFLASEGRGCLASTILFIDDALRVTWEPEAPSVDSRMDAIKKAHDAGVKTWVSVEPVIVAEEALKLIKLMHPYVDLWKVGKLNYLPEEKLVNWKKFATDVYVLLNDVKADYVIKDSLKPFLPEGATAIKRTGKI